MAFTRYSLRADRFVTEWIRGGGRDSYYMSKLGKRLPTNLSARPYSYQGCMYVELAERNAARSTGFRDPAWLASQMNVLTKSVWEGFPRMPNDMQKAMKIIKACETHPRKSAL